MSQLIEIFNAWSTAWLGLVVAILWQSTALAAVALLVAPALRRVGPALSYWVWQIVMIKLLVMPFWIIGLPAPSVFNTRPMPVTEASPVPRTRNFLGEVRPLANAMLPADRIGMSDSIEPSHELSLLSRVKWPSWLMVAWLTIMAWQVARIAYQRVQLGQLLSQAKPAEDIGLNELLSAVAVRLELRRVPRAALTDRDCSPFVFGVWRPIVVLPRSLLAALDAAQLRQVLLHELAHIKRRDLLLGWPPTIARLVYWFHPVVHWVWRRIQFECELACDQLAIALSGRRPGAYANTLVQVAGHSSGEALFQAAAASAGFCGGANYVPTKKEPGA